MPGCAVFRSQVRLTMMVLLILSMNNFFTVEQPAQSILYRHKRWEWLANKVCWETWQL